MSTSSQVSIKIILDEWILVWVPGNGVTAVPSKGISVSSGCESNAKEAKGRRIKAFNPLGASKTRMIDGTRFSTNVEVSMEAGLTLIDEPP